VKTQNEGILVSEIWIRRRPNRSRRGKKTESAGLIGKERINDDDWAEERSLKGKRARKMSSKKRQKLKSIEKKKEDGMRERGKGRR
jgi:hypothetical protein